MVVHDLPMSASSNGVVQSRRARLALRLAVIAAVVVAFGTAAASISMAGLGADLVGAVGVLGFTAVGAVILDRRPGEPIGRICLTLGFMYGVAAILRGIANVVNDLEGRLPPAFAATAVISGAIAALALLLGGPLLVSRFPRRAAKAWQRRIEDILVAMVAFVVVVGALKQGSIDNGTIQDVPNPLAIDWMPIDGGTIFTATLLVYGLCYLATALGLVNRYRRGGAIVRAQIRWFAAAIAASLLLFLATVLSSGNEAINSVAWSAWILSLFLPPVAIGIAILRYHLYDIDRIISNAIGYGLVTMILFGVFAVVNLGLQEIASRVLLGTSVSEFQGFAVAASTLLVAILFQPIRTRVQHDVDRRFHRARYDANRMVAEFSGRLRDEVDLPTVTADLVGTTDATLAPTSLAIWIRENAR